MIEQSLAGPIGLFVKFSTLQDYGVDKVFFLENDNLDASQKNVVFLASGEKANQCIAIAGMYVEQFFLATVRRWITFPLKMLRVGFLKCLQQYGTKSRLCRLFPTLLDQS